MKNIKKSIFVIMMIIVSVSRIENYWDQPEDIENLFAKMAAMQARKAKIEALELEAEARAAKFEAERSAFQIELEVMPVATEMMPREMDMEQAENLLRQCLIENRYSNAMGQSGIPKVCEDFTKILRLLGGSVEADELIEAFQQ